MAHFPRNSRFLEVSGKGSKFTTTTMIACTVLLVRLLSSTNWRGVTDRFSRNSIKGLKLPEKNLNKKDWKGDSLLIVAS